MNATRTTSPDVIVRQATAEDSSSVLELVSEMWGRDVRARYDWLYRRNPHGQALSWLACDAESGRVVGVKSLFPRRASIEGHATLAALGGDAFVRPSHRGRGLLELLHRAAMLEMQEQGIEISPGVPAKSSYRSLLRGGSRHIGWFARWVRPLTGQGLVRRQVPGLLRWAGQASISGLDLVTSVRGPLSPRGLRMEPVRSREELQRLLVPAAGEARVLFERDPAWLAWRFLDAPAARQHLVGLWVGNSLTSLAALEQSEGRATLVDLVTPPHGARTALQAVLRHAQASGASVLDVSCSESASFARALPGLGFIRRDRAAMVNYVPAGHPRSAALLSGRGWHFTLADLDGDAYHSGPSF